MLAENRDLRKCLDPLRASFRWQLGALRRIAKSKDEAIANNEPRDLALLGPAEAWFRVPLVQNAGRLLSDHISIALNWGIPCPLSSVMI